LEALACGAPVIATAVGGISEQVRGLDLSDSGLSFNEWHRHAVDDATGVLVPKGDAEAMAAALIQVLKNDSVRSRLRQNAIEDASQRFDLQRQVNAYEEWYDEILADDKLTGSRREEAVQEKCQVI
jgi:glycosyltransferase involved in cell wall biosynthesis